MLSIDGAEKIRKVVESKDYIAQLVNEVAKTLIEAFENLKIEDVNMYQLGYSKAIDDFKEELFKNSERARPVGWLGYSEIVTCEKIYEIAEQLKAGGENERM